MRKSSKLLVLALVAIMIVSCFAFVACNKNAEGEKAVVGAYIMTDKATFLSMKKAVDGDTVPNLEILLEKNDELKNTYTLIAVDPNGEGFGASKPTLNTVGADALINWFNLESTRKLIADYGKDTYGEALFTLLETAPAAYTGEIPTATNKTKDIKLSTTTSVKDSGLLTPLLAKFKADYGYEVDVFAKGTGISIQNAQKGNADLILVHAKASEEDFVKDGYARKVTGYSAERISFMYNFFVICGPNADPAGVKTAANASAAFKAIGEGGYNFVSRGDNSGTNTAECKIWKAAGFTDITSTKDSEGNIVITGPEKYAWYKATGKGMGASLTTANGMFVKD